jgi:hypothetical protein
MKKLISLLAAITLISTGCDSGTSSGYYNDYDGYGYSSEYNTESAYDEPDEPVEPENPYDGYEEGHYAGYEWALENEVDDCDGNSQSFIEGCEEYVSQRNQYQEGQDAYDEWESNQDSYEDYEYDSYPY